MTNLTDEGLREMARQLMRDGFIENDATVVDVVASALQQIRDAAKKEEINGETSDGYHTFNELYDHRVLLWINLCLLQHPDMTYLVENHYDGWFLLGCETPQGQISYHCPNKYLGLVSGIKRRHPEFDGHTSKDVISRLERTAIRQMEGWK